MRTTWALATSAVLGLSLLVGCGTQEATGSAGDQAPSPSSSASSPTTSAEPSSPAKPSRTVAPADGPTIKGKGVEVVVPQGWSVVQELAGPDVVLTATHTGVDDSPENLFVRDLGDPVGDAAEAARSNRAYLEDQDGVTKVEDLGSTEIGGRTASHVRGVRNQGGLHEQLDQFWVAGGQRSMVLTFRTNRWQIHPNPRQVVASVLATVRWTGSA